MGFLRRKRAKREEKREAAKRSEAEEQRFRHASGSTTLDDVISAQSPSYEEGEVKRPRGRAARLHPDGSDPQP